LSPIALIERNAYIDGIGKSSSGGPMAGRLLTLEAEVRAHGERSNDMPRKPRVVESGVVYHVFNRRTDRQCLFDSAAAYDEFLDLVSKGRQRYAVRHHAYCLMSTHWHFALSVDKPSELGRYLRWLATSHAVRFRRHSGTRGNGHVYQDRYKAIPAFGLVHYVTLIRYIEANPLAAGLVARAEEWQWSSLAARGNSRRRLLDPDPWKLPSCWIDIVNSSDSILRLFHHFTFSATASPRVLPTIEGVTRDAE
jgi:putative transposase